MQSISARRGMAVAPHSLAAQSALDVLRDGGNALEAMIAAASTIAVVYPHMNAIGGDGFWLVHMPGRPVVGIDACGRSAGAASVDWYREHGIEDAIPFRGGVAANTVAGAISGWGMAYRLSRRVMRGRIPLSRLLEDAVHYAERGFPVTGSQSSATSVKRAELENVPGYADVFLPGGAVPKPGSVFLQKRLGSTLRRIGQHGTDDFYRGDLAQTIARDLARAGSPVTAQDLRLHKALLCDPLVLNHSRGKVYNMPPPTQGLASLLILGMLDELKVGTRGPASAEFVHLSVEATKQAFRVRDRVVSDPARMHVDAQEMLRPKAVRTLAQAIDETRTAPWGAGKPGGDTIWMSVVDRAGRAVSYIQSIYHEFGSGVVLPKTGITWQNRGTSFSLRPDALNRLEPWRKPFHTLNPAMARLSDGRVIAYGTMGGDGQPQTQAAIFTRMVNFGMHPRLAIREPRWLLGRTWGSPSDTLKVEARFPGGMLMQLGRMGHEIEVLQDFDETMGHAGAIVCHPNGTFEGGCDPRSDGAVAAF